VFQNDITFNVWLNQANIVHSSFKGYHKILLKIITGYYVIKVFD